MIVVLKKFKQVDTMIPWNASPIAKYWKLGTLAEGVQVVLPYNNDQPALLERSVGQGRVLMLTTSISESPTDRFAWNYLLVPREEECNGRDDGHPDRDDLPYRVTIISDGHAQDPVDPSLSTIMT